MTVVNQVFTPRRIIGIDVGLNGAIAMLNGESLHDVVDMPTVTLDRNGKAKRQISIPELVAIIDDFKPDEAYCERVFAMSGQGVTSVFSFGRSLGAIEGILGARLIKTTLVTPQAWQKAMGVSGGKDGARARAMEVFPWSAGLFKRVKDDGRADAALIAAWGLRHG
jgi:crossover junction endodeoxyribonuclease RuvC